MNKRSNNANNSNFVYFAPDMSKEEAERAMELLKQGIIKIQSGNASTLRFEELYRKAYTLVLHKHGALLYDGVEEVIVDKLNKTSGKMLAQNNDVLIDGIINEWEDHITKMGMIRDILMYMDKTRCEEKHRPTVYNLGLITFLDRVLRREDLLERIRKKLLKNIHHERTETEAALDNTQMRNCLRIFHEVDVQNLFLYESEFETYFLEESVNFYKKESSDKLATHSIGDYLKLVEARMAEEQRRSSVYLDFRDTKRKLMQRVDDQLILAHFEYFIENTVSGVVVMFGDDRRDDLSRLYRLCESVDKRRASVTPNIPPDQTTVGKLAIVFKDYVYDVGKKIVDDPENRQNPQRFVEQVLSLLAKHNGQVEECFQDEPLISVKLTSTFVAFINKDMCAAKYLSQFVDNLLKNCGKESQAELNKSLDDVMVLFKYIKDKDIFEDFYRTHITKRLLQGKHASDDIERNMIARLKQECGYQYTSKLEGMFQDIQQSKEFEKKWKQYLRETGQGNTGIEFTCQVLTMGFWPFSQQRSECRLPDEIVAIQSVFTDFYRQRHEGRKLTYNLTQGSADLLVEFDAGTKELCVNTYQMCILNLFNKKDIYTFEQISDLTCIPLEELKRNILSLAHPKVRVLCKNPNTKSIQNNHQFKFNNKYKNPRYRIQMPMLKKNTKIEPNEMPSSVQEGRKNRVEAAIVRIMKTRKTLQHNLLVSELIKQLSSKFQPDPAFLKKRIESLIEREFLERDQEDWRTYRYLA